MEEQEENLRLYSFGNMYLQGVQSGIQCQHCNAELFTKYLPFEHLCSDMLYNWANHHKTTILLNGGMAKDLEELKSFLLDYDRCTGQNKLPWAYFNESREALGGCITNISIIVPERIYNFDIVGCTTTAYPKTEIPKVVDGIYTLNSLEYELARRIKSCKLMS